MQMADLIQLSCSYVNVSENCSVMCVTFPRGKRSLYFSYRSALVGQNRPAVAVKWSMRTAFMTSGVAHDKPA